MDNYRKNTLFDFFSMHVKITKNNLKYPEKEA